MEMSGYATTAAQGETFDLIAYQIYGDEKFAADMLCANPEYAEKTVFDGGEKLLLPVVEVTARTDEPSATEPETAPWRE